MSRLQTIEDTLSAINEAVFQELCDSFLALRNKNYAAFSRTGSQSGKQKTVKGTPDTFVLLPNGKYIFVEYSTNITAGLPKLKDDIMKCLNPAKTGISIDLIAEIIICINFNLKASEIEKLKSLLSDTRIHLTVYTLDALAIELHLNHRDLTHVYLGLALDTGQIVSVDQFAAEYNKASKGISTPIDNTFLHRESELKELDESIHAYDFVLLTGAPGIGKTKLALESIKHFLQENISFTAFCVSYKNHTLLEDLYQYFESDKDYLLFVDDANRIDAFNQITGFYKSIRKGKLKIIITVRDYAYQEIGILCREFSTKRIDLVKFSDEQITDIIKAEPFQILHSDYQTEIIRIADGNPRLAIMTALLAKAKQNIAALADVSELFEKYFSTFISDDGGFTDKLNIKCLGIIAFFYTIPYKDKELTSSILSNFDIDYSDFIEAIDKLDKLELVEIQFEHVKIPEQNLSTYFFYKAFVKEDLLSFQVLLDKYFDTNSNRFKDTVIPANNTFGYDNVMIKLKPHLQSHWRSIFGDSVRAFKYLNTFWYYLQPETIKYVFNIVNSMPVKETSNYGTQYETNVFGHDSDLIIELLSLFFRFPVNLKDVLELSFEYVRKTPENLPRLIYQMREQLTFDRRDERYNFERQRILFNCLLGGVEKQDKLYSVIFFELSKTFLSFQFRQTRGGRNYTFYMYEYRIPNSPVIHEFRRKIWSGLDTGFVQNFELAFDLLKSYSSVRLDVSKELMEFDILSVIPIIEKHLSNTNFEHCKYVHDQIRWWQRNNIINSQFELIAQKFTNHEYELFLKLDWDRLRDKESFDFENYNEYQALKEADIRASFHFSSLSEIEAFYEVYAHLKHLAKSDWYYANTLDIIIDENCKINFETGCQILRLIIQLGNEINYVPRYAFANHLTTIEKSEIIWTIIQRAEFRLKTLWELSFYDNLDTSLINKNYVGALIDTISDINESSTIHFDRLQRFLEIEPNLFQMILRKVVKKNEDEDAKLQVWMDFFNDHFDKLGDDIALIKKAYLQQVKLQNYFDHQGAGFLGILKRDPNFLIEYIENLYSTERFALPSDTVDLGFIWQIENIELVVNKTFDLISEREPYFGISEHFCNSFFKGIQSEYTDKVSNFLLDYCKANCFNSQRMNIVVDITRHTIKGLFEAILLCFLSLNQDVKLFSEIWWIGNGGVFSGDLILGDLQAAEWNNVLSIVNKADIGTKLIPIKIYIGEKIEGCLKSGDLECQRRFLERH